MQDKRRRGCVAEPTGPKIPRCPISTGRSYPRMIKNVRSSYNQLCEARSTEEIGRRARTLNEERTEELIRADLARWTGQSLGRISKFLAQAEYLTDECLKKLDQSGADEDFFDAAQPVKAILIKNMLIKGLDQKEIEEKISKAILEMRKEYQDTAKLDRRRWLLSQIDTTGTGPAWASGTEVFGKPQILKYKRAPESGNSTMESLTMGDIPERLDELAMEVRQSVKKARSNPVRLARRLRVIIIRMAKLHEGVLHQENQAKGDTEDGDPR